VTDAKATTPREEDSMAAGSFARALQGIVVAGLVLAPLAGCDSPAGPEPVPCSHATIFQGSATVPANAKESRTFTSPALGAMAVTVDWTFELSTVSVVVAQAPCSVEQLQNAECNVQFSLWSPPKPLTGSTRLLPAGQYALVFANPNPVPQVVTAHVDLRSAGCPTGPATEVSVPGRVGS
jgi:hypothetical protein